MPYSSWFWHQSKFMILPSPCLGSFSLPVSFASRENGSSWKIFAGNKLYSPGGLVTWLLRTPRRLTYAPVLRLSVGEGKYIFILLQSFQVSICPSFLSNDMDGGVERATMWSLLLIWHDSTSARWVRWGRDNAPNWLWSSHIRQQQQARVEKLFY